MFAALTGDVAPVVVVLVGIIWEGCWCALPPVSMVRDWMPLLPRTLFVGVTMELG